MHCQTLLSSQIETPGFASLENKGGGGERKNSEEGRKKSKVRLTGQRIVFCQLFNKRTISAHSCSKNVKDLH